MSTLLGFISQTTVESVTTSIGIVVIIVKVTFRAAISSKVATDQHLAECKALRPHINLASIAQRLKSSLELIICRISVFQEGAVFIAVWHYSILNDSLVHYSFRLRPSAIVRAQVANVDS